MSPPAGSGSVSEFIDLIRKLCSLQLALAEDHSETKSSKRNITYGMYKEIRPKTEVGVQMSASDVDHITTQHEFC